MLNLGRGGHEGRKQKKMTDDASLAPTIVGRPNPLLIIYFKITRPAALATASSDYFLQAAASAVHTLWRNQLAFLSVFRSRGNKI